MFVFESELLRNPAPHNQSGFNIKTMSVYKSPRERDYIAELETRLCSQIYRDRAFKRYGEVPIKVDYTFGFEPPKSWSKKKRQQALDREIYPTAQNLGDWDNLAKSTQDRLNKLIIADDRFIVDGRVRKLYTEKPYIKIEIDEVKL